MTLLELRNWIRRQAREITSAEIPDTTLTALINEGYEDFAARSGCFIRFIDLTIPVNTPEVDLPTFVVDILEAVDGTKVIRSATERDLQILVGADWRTRTANVPDYFVKISPGRIRVVPYIPSAGTARTWSCTAVVIPSSATGAPVPLLSADTDVPQLPTIYHRALAYYAMLQLALQNPANTLMTPRVQQYYTNYIELVTLARNDLGVSLAQAQLQPLLQPAAASRSAAGGE